MSSTGRIADALGVGLIVAGAILLWRALRRNERVEAPKAGADDQAAPAS